MYIQEIDVGILEKKDEGQEPRMQGCVARDAHDKGGRYRFDARRRPRPVEPSFSVSKLCATPPPHFNDLPLPPRCSCNWVPPTTLYSLNMLAARSFASPARQCLRQANRSRWAPALSQVSFHVIAGPHVCQSYHQLSHVPL